MEIKRSPAKHFLLNSHKPLKTATITRIWANDGWCYIPQLKTRERFTETTFFSEMWEGIIPIPLYSEVLIRETYSQMPLIWRERGQEFDEIFEECISSQSIE